MLSFDDVFTSIGAFGKHQKLNTFFCCSLVFLTVSFTNSPIVFLVASPKHWCKIPTLSHLNISLETRFNLSIPFEISKGRGEYSQCSQYDRDYTNWTMFDLEDSISGKKENLSVVPCKSGYEYDKSVYTSTAITEWDVVCADSIWVATSKAMYLAGFLLGSLLFGYTADRFGRKKTYIATLVLGIIFSLLIPLSINFTMFMVLRLLIGMTTMGNFSVMYIMIMEIIGLEWRGFFSLMCNYQWGVADILASGLAYLIRDWRYLSLALATPVFLQIMNIFLVEESPRWLFIQNRTEEANAILHRIAKMNGKDFEKKLDIRINREERGHFSDLVLNSTMRFRMAILIIQWIAVTMAFYGLVYNSADLGFGKNPHLNFLMSALMGIPACIICHIFQRFAGRKTVIITFDIIGGVSLLAILAIPSSFSGAYHLTVVLSLLGRLCAWGIFVLIGLYTAELMPTVFRSLGLGINNSAARIGGISAQYLMELKDVSPFIPYISMGGLSIISGLLLLLLPETKGRKLMEIMENKTTTRNSTIEVDGFTQEPREKLECTTAV